jgi:hypothetical protein
MKRRIRILFIEYPNKLSAFIDHAGFYTFIGHYIDEQGRTVIFVELLQPPDDGWLEVQLKGIVKK